MLEVKCEHCDTHLAYYQKDGPGILKRMYIDRFINGQSEGKELSCNNCGRTVGVLILYEKENRPAYRLFVGAVTKKIVSRNTASLQN